MSVQTASNAQLIATDVAGSGCAILFVVMTALEEIERKGQTVVGLCYSLKPYRRFTKVRERPILAAMDEDGLIRIGADGSVAITEAGSSRLARLRSELGSV